MAAVLFLVTIPTEIEENRLKQEFIAKKYDAKFDQTDNTALAVKVSDNKTTTTTAVNTDFEENQELINENCSNPETISSKTIDVAAACIDNNGGEVAGAASTLQYGTFPKRRRKSEPKMTNLESIKSKRNSASDVGVNITDGVPKAWEGFRDILSSTKRRAAKRKTSKEESNEDLPKEAPMEQVLQKILSEFQIQNAIWAKDGESKMHQIFFTVEFNEIYEKILQNLNEWGIGEREGSTISVMNCIASKTFSHKDPEFEGDISPEKNLAQKQGAWERFMNSVRSRLNVAQIVRDVRQDAAITFDFVILLVSAAILASFGLVEDSTIFLASSMLISPLMGPIIAAIFGTVIKDHSLRKLGLKNELIGILLAIFVGFIFGMVVCSIDDRFSTDEGLTDEMLSRCELHSLVVGVFTAIPSGAAAAIGILGGNIGSLVGVAISASLLPPAVNSGLLWALAVIYKVFEKDESRYSNFVKTSIYSNNQATELAILGSISMCLTISNVICIYIMGILVLKIKEIAPVISRNNRKFWKHDIKIARDLNRNGFDTDTAIIDEFANLPKEDQKALGLNSDFFRKMDEASYQNTWSPIGSRHPFEPSYEQIRENYSTVHRIERLYSTISQHNPMKDKKAKFSMSRRPTGRLSDFGTSYKILSENIPRCSTMPTKVICPKINIIAPADIAVAGGVSSGNITTITETVTPTGTFEGRKRRKFIVTPAEEDPLNPISPLDDIDV